MSGQAFFKFRFWGHNSIEKILFINKLHVHMYTHYKTQFVGRQCCLSYRKKPLSMHISLSSIRIRFWDSHQLSETIINIYINPIYINLEMETFKDLVN